ncbi:MAG: CpsD/CapB family tyrosine-protein kinase, partial [Bacteroidales bacterium]|nr:CpsD/CapB family tyrosine-protein kinase [Bacteroidales bacterium]
NIPILSDIPLCNKEDFFVVEKEKNNAISELYRLLRNNLQFTLISPDKKVIMVTSSISGEGKTFVASNLAISFANTGKKTLLIGIDIRRPMAAIHFGFDNKNGITTYLSSQEKDFNNIIQHTSYTDLDVIPGGPVPPNPNELLLSDKLDSLIAEMRKRYDYIIIDSAPVGMVSDTFLLDRVADVTLFVTRSEFTSKSHIKSINALASSGRLKSLYLCINAVDMTARTYSYRRYGYGYKASYGNYGYEDEFTSKERNIFSFMKKK